MKRFFALLFLVFTISTAAEAAEGQLKDTPRYLLYLPAQVKTRRAPLVLALSPVADSYSLLMAWKEVANNHGWIILASKEFRNGVDSDLFLPQLETILKEAISTYPIDTSRIAVTGFSGGAMGSYMVACAYPRLIRAVVVNTGVIHESYTQQPEKHPFPRQKLAVLLASPADHLYHEMKNNRDFLNARGWETAWIEFGGGHDIAPSSAYEKAAQWLETQW